MFVLIGALFLLPTLMSLRFKKTALKGFGTVTGYEVEVHAECDKYHPLVKYLDQSGKEHTATVTGGTSKTFAENQQVEVLYSPTHPLWLEIVGYKPHRELYVFSFVFIFLGSLFALIGLGNPFK